VNGTGLRVLNVVDEFTRLCVGCFVAYSIGASEVRRLMEQTFEAHGRPEIIRSDNGREFIAKTLLDWYRDEQGVNPVQVEKGSPQQNCYVERFNGSTRGELLNLESFRSLTEARVMITRWVEEYNNDRPHSSLGNRTPVEFAAYCAAQPESPSERGQ
jgi:putative transposase